MKNKDIDTINDMMKNKDDGSEQTVLLKHNCYINF